ncbi:MAG: phosphatase PAP2 family protein [Pseudomonadota bacterium]
MMHKSLTILFVVSGLAATPASANPDDWDSASSVVRTALVAAAIGTPLIEDDDEGLRQSAYSLGTAFLVTEGLKRTFPETRPDGSDNRSFPSGHTSVSFAAAATLQQRHGWDVGIPAHLAAAFVGVARHEAGKHHWHDVLVGAAIGEASGLLLTSNRHRNVVGSPPAAFAVAVIPWGDTSGGGITFAARF